VKSFKDLDSMGVSHFGDLFKALEHENIGEMLSILDHFLRLVEVEENEYLYQLVSVEELLAIIKSFSKDKSPGLNGWTT
jgi:DNA-binding transcriptional ArsR family regulator